VSTETKAERKLRLKKVQLKKHIAEQELEIKKWNPYHDKKIEGNPYNTIFVGRLNYITTEERLKKEFEIYGPVVNVRVVLNKQTKKSRGYAFVEFAKDRDADYAVLKADGRKIEGNRVIVDRELGRTREKWLPRRLGGGKGDVRKDRKDEDVIKKLMYEIKQEERVASPKH